MLTVFFRAVIRSEFADFTRCSQPRWAHLHCFYEYNNCTYGRCIMLFLCWDCSLNQGSADAFIRCWIQELSISFKTINLCAHPYYQFTELRLEWDLYPVQSSKLAVTLPPLNRLSAETTACVINNFCWSKPWVISSVCDGARDTFRKTCYSRNSL